MFKAIRILILLLILATVAFYAKVHKLLTGFRPIEAMPENAGHDC